MWVTRARYEELIRAEAKVMALGEQLQHVGELLQIERERADRATDAALVVRNVPPIAPQKQSEPERAMFEDQPEELAQMMKELKINPAGVLLREGQGDAGRA